MQGSSLAILLSACTHYWPLRLAYSSPCCLSKICWHVAGPVLQHSPAILVVMEHARLFNHTLPTFALEELSGDLDICFNAAQRPGDCCPII